MMDVQPNSVEQETVEQPQAATGTDQAKTEKAERAFSQAEVDAFVKARLERERAKFAGYDELKAKAAKWQEYEDAQKSEIEKAQAKLAEFQAQIARLSQEKAESLIRSAVISEAVKRGFRDPDDAYRMIDLAGVALGEDGKATGIAEALQALGESKPYLLQQQEQQQQPQTVRIGPTNLPRGQQPEGETDEQRRKRLFGGGDAPLGRKGGVFWPKV